MGLFTMYIEKQAVHLIEKVVQRSGSIELPAQGYSMFPLIQKGDICTFNKCDPLHMKKGDIVLFYSPSGQLVAHRFYHKELMSNEMHFRFKGDTNLGFDQPVKAQQIIGRLTSIRSKKRVKSVEDSLVSLWGRLVVTLPVLSGLLHTYLNRKNRVQY